MIYLPGAIAPSTGIYWCTVCKTPERIKSGQEFPQCKNLCGRGHWELVEDQSGQSPAEQE